MFNKLMFHTPTLLQGAILGGAILAIPVAFFLTVQEGSPPLGGLMAVLAVAALLAFKVVGHPRLWGGS